jgi:hypothetical protein
MCVCSVFSQLTINIYSEITASFQQVLTVLCKYFVLIKIFLYLMGPVENIHLPIPTHNPIQKPHRLSDRKSFVALLANVKSDYRLGHACSSVCLHETTRLPLHEMFVEFYNSAVLLKFVD